MMNNREKIYKRINILDLFDEPEDFIEEFEDEINDDEYEELVGYGQYSY
ncbi:MAG: hypothetical protein GX915_07285 [Clostridiales bacterium]|nr:hypothetical protein [Clostridiales bacterium]